jgi:uncharacterized protein YkwD
LNVAKDGTTCKITGTPTAVTAEATYTVKGTNASGEDTATVVITVNDIPVVVPALADATAQTYTKDTAISAVTFVNSGGDVESCTVAPALPAGLSVVKDGTTCKITGTPTVVTAEKSYTVKGTNASGEDTATVVITVNDIAGEVCLTTIAKDNSNHDAKSVKTVDGVEYTFIVYTDSTPDKETSQSTIAVYGQVTGEVEGQTHKNIAVSINETYSDSAKFQIIIFNTNGEKVGCGTITDYSSSSINVGALNIETAELELPALADATAQNYTKDTAITALSFTNTGGAVDSCSVNPTLPAGLTLAKDGATCKITGTPTEVTSPVEYTVTGTNVTGTDTATVTIEIENNEVPLTLEEKIVLRHNVYRNLVFQDSNLTWDADLAAHAQTWADYLAVNYVKNEDGTRPSPHARQYQVDLHTEDDYFEGENIAWTSNEQENGYFFEEPINISVENVAHDKFISTGIGGAIDSWANEKAYYDYANNTGNGHTVGHYTQVVWKNTSKVGCGKAKVTTAYGGTFVVCRYSTPGNYVGERPY